MKNMNESWVCPMKTIWRNPLWFISYARITWTTSQIFTIILIVQTPEKAIKNIPTLVSQLNVYKDKNGLLRVKAKFKTWNGKIEFPILLSKHSEVERWFVIDMHHSLSHGSIHRVIAEFRKLYWVPLSSNLIKKMLKDCILCRKI